MISKEDSEQSTRVKGGTSVEPPMKFELVINLKYAKQIGLTISQWTLMKSDTVIR